MRPAVCVSAGIRPATVIVAYFAASIGWAHHGIANFNLNADIEVSGIVTDVTFINPHSWVYIDVTGEDSAVTPWRCELRGATVLRRSGWTEEMFPPGMRIRITGSPDRRDPTTCYTGTVVFPDGTSVDRYGQIDTPPAVSGDAPRFARRPNGDPNFAGDWAGEQRVMTDPRGQRGTLVPLGVAKEFAPGEVPGGGAGFPGARGTAVSFEEDPVDFFWNQRASIFPLSARGEAVMADFDGASSDNPRLRCEATNILFDWTFETDVNQIDQTDESMRLLYGSMGLDRIIYLGLDSHPTESIPSIVGHSIGRWEDDTLVVDTVGFAPGLLSVDGRLPHGEGLHVVERFTLSDDARTLTREYTAEDPAYFDGQFRGADAVHVAELRFTGTTPCEDMTYRTQ
jgi:hypothetical protein